MKERTLTDYLNMEEDKRGWIEKINIGDNVCWISFTKKGYGRGGDVHNGRQYNVIIKGSFLVKELHEGIERETVVATGRLITIQDGIPHVFIALEDTWMIEWHEFPLPPFKEKKYYEPYRKLCK